MIEEQGVVTENLSPTVARVRVTQGSACRSCSCSSVCYSLTGKTERVVEVSNPLQAGVGQPVIIGIREKVLLSASFWLYLVPLGGLFSGIILVKLLVSKAAEIWLAAAGVIGLGLGFAAAHWHSKYLPKEDYQPVILRLGTVSPGEGEDASAG